MATYDKLKHGAIYEMTTADEARCNISTCGLELWFTVKSGGYIGGKPIKLLRDSDVSFANDDVK
jgi:hypothetical protein